MLLLLFARSVGWTREVFGPQPVRGRAWMWIAVALVLIPVVMRLVATNWSAYSVAVVLSLLFLGLCVGFAEELLTRGLVVTMLRRGGYGERLVFVLSTLYFALLHSGNVFSGQSPVAVLVTVVYTFGFGGMMYLSLRLTGRLIWPILLHAATDPTTILATGGIDAHGSSEGDGTLLSLAGTINIVYTVLALVAIFLIKNRRTTPASTLTR
ncbi:CPBP family intramembrane glutamic endopeptidase [Herbiconiux sp. L3-i23]|uniref:CPBP family intramembrane glutamic endopeptidase n=1 Tax=Herbiconiux sp. L3-i23 TaxID=2905871 RepID=UPI002072A99F|nr:CPBP family intramembrane glutamic endopeptidase [Herbiconiux sp. L3-i23]